MMLLGLIAAGINASEMTCCTKRKRQKERQNPRTIYMHEGQRICIETFMFLYGYVWTSLFKGRCVLSPFFSISKKRLNRIRKHYAENGLVPLESAGGGHRSSNAISFEDTQKLVTFLRNYAEDHALVLPGRVPGVWKDDVVLLPSSHTKAFVFAKYKDAMEGG